MRLQLEREFVMNSIEIIVIIKLFLIFWSTDACVLEYRRINYFKLKTCHSSELPRVGSKNVDSLRECVTFARERNGLAFNFSPPEASKIFKSKNRSFANCQILGCPELGNSTSLIPDENFDYYSAFGNMNNTSNATCISSTGIFTIIKEKGNYIKSITKCQNIGADLADVLTETRTKQLASLVNSTVGSWYKASYVGLDDLQSRGLFESSNGNHIYCTQYRAWGPGHPRLKRGNYSCVTLHSDKTWKAVPCDVELTAICEFIPESPSVDEFDERHLCNKISNRRNKRRCLANKKSLKKLIERSSRKDKCALLNYDKDLSRI